MIYFFPERTTGISFGAYSLESIDSRDPTTHEAAKAEQQTKFYVDSLSESSITMATRAFVPLLRRSIVATRTQTNALRGGTPPMPAFVRIPAPTEPVS